MKRPFSLLEVLIAMSLASILITCLLVGYLRSSQLSSTAEAKLWPLWEHQALDRQLAAILQRITPAPLYTENDDLIFTYNAGVDDDPHFCGQCLARLYLDNHQRLILATWPNPARWELDPIPYRTQILTTDLQSLTLRFYDRPGESTYGPNAGWHTSWPRDFDTLPALIEVTLDTFSHTYPVFAADKPPRYYRT